LKYFKYTDQRGKLLCIYKYNPFDNLEKQIWSFDNHTIWEWEPVSLCPTGWKEIEISKEEAFVEIL